MALVDSNGRVIPDAEALKIAADELIRLREMPGWQFLIMQLRADADNALDALAHVDPFDREEIMRLQNSVQRLNWFEETVDQLIQNGIQVEALEQSEQYRRESEE